MCGIYFVREHIDKSFVLQSFLLLTATSGTILMFTTHFLSTIILFLEKYISFFSKTF